VQTRLRRKGLCKEREKFIVKSETDVRTGQVDRGAESVAVPSDGGAEGCRSCLGREFQSTGAWWVKNLSVTLRCERTEGRCRVIISEERVVRLD